MLKSGFSSQSTGAFFESGGGDFDFSPSLGSQLGCGGDVFFCALSRGAGGGGGLELGGGP